MRGPSHPNGVQIGDVTLLIGGRTEPRWWMLPVALVDLVLGGGASDGAERELHYVYASRAGREIARGLECRSFKRARERRDRLVVDMLAWEPERLARLSDGDWEQLLRRI
jgi:hypothetical protein